MRSAGVWCSLEWEYPPAALVCRGFLSGFLIVRVPLFDVSCIASMLPAGVLLELLQLP
jgi:hypothetical protein